MAGRELVLEASMSQLVAADVIGTTCGRDLEHVGIYIDELDANGWQRIEDRGGETAGPGSEVNDESSGRDGKFEIGFSDSGVAGGSRPSERGHAQRHGLNATSS